MDDKNKKLEKVKFKVTKKVPKLTKVKFYTKTGKKVSFKAIKKTPKTFKVEFYAKKRKKIKRIKTKKVVYFDTNVILDYILKRKDFAPILWQSIKTRNWKIITSTFTMMEIADWKKRDLFIRNKIELKWDMDNILSHKNKLDLINYEFQKTYDWLLSCEDLIKINFIELGKVEAWLEAKEISAKTNLLAKDALHFSTAYISALNDECDYLITSDGEFIKSANYYLEKNKNVN